MGCKECWDLGTLGCPEFDFHNMAPYVYQGDGWEEQGAVSMSPDHC